MDKCERIKMVKCMEYIARQLNDEDIFGSWLVYGVADGDIPYGDTEYNAETDDEDMEYYIEDDTFAILMDDFLRLMRSALKSGGLYCDGIVSMSAKEFAEKRARQYADVGEQA